MTSDDEWRSLNLLLNITSNQLKIALSCNPFFWRFFLHVLPLEAPMSNRFYNRLSGFIVEQQQELINLAWKCKVVVSFILFSCLSHKTMVLKKMVGSSRHRTGSIIVLQISLLIGRQRTWGHQGKRVSSLVPPGGQ